MPDTTPVYSLPFPESADAPDGAAQIQDLAEAVETELVRIDASAPLGIVGSLAMGTSADVGTTEVITDSITFTAAANRAYRVSVVTPVLDNQATNNQTAIIMLRWASGATVTTAATSVAKAIKNTPPSTTSSNPGTAAETVTLIGYVNNPAAGQVTVGIGLAAAAAGSNVRFLASGTTGPDKAGVFVVEDVGSNY